jgi:hypothetical protein
MKLALWFTGLMLALFAGMHIFIAFEHWHQVGPDRESVVGPVLTALVTASLAVWVLLRASRSKPAA